MSLKSKIKKMLGIVSPSEFLYDVINENLDEAIAQAKQDGRMIGIITGIYLDNPGIEIAHDKARYTLDNLLVRGKLTERMHDDYVNMNDQMYFNMKKDIEKICRKEVKI